MHKAVFTLLVITEVCRPLAAQTAPWADKMFAGDLVHEFGVVPRRAQLKYAFKMTNIWKVPLEITNVRVSCGCVTVKESTKVLQPNETGFLNINMDGTRFIGQKQTQIYVTLGPERISTATLTVRANARLDVVFNPGEIDFGLIHHGQTPTKFIDVEYAGSLPWAVSEIFVNRNDPFELKSEVLRNRASKGYRIYATVKADAPAGSFRQEILLKTNDPASPMLAFNVLGNVQATVSVVPDVIVAGAKIGEMETKKVVVRGSRPFRIVGIDGQGDGITAVVPDSKAQTQIVTIRFQPARAGEMKKQLVIRTDLDNEQVTVTVEGTGT